MADIGEYIDDLDGLADNLGSRIKELEKRASPVNRGQHDRAIVASLASAMQIVDKQQQINTLLLHRIEEIERKHS